MNITDIKTQNVKKILNALRFGQGLTKKEIALITDLSFSTVSNICNELKEIHVLDDKKVEQSGIGRMPNQLTFQSDRFCTICLDLQMRNVLGFAILSFGNQLLFHQKYDISHCETPEEIISFTKQVYDDLYQRLQLEAMIFVGVGVSVSAALDRDTCTLVNCAIPSMENVPVIHLIERTFGLYCYVDNEANLCALSMRCQNPGFQNSLYLHLSQGVGAGIICEGNLLRGRNGYAAEISHIPLGNISLQCPVCNNYGCIEPTLCLKGVAQTLTGSLVKDITLEDWAALAKEINDNPEKFKAPLNEIGGQIGLLLSVLINLFDPEAIYIGGNIADIYDVLIPLMMPLLESRCSFICQKAFTITCDKESDLTILQGLNQSIYEKWNGYDIPCVNRPAPL